MLPSYRPYEYAVQSATEVLDRHFGDRGWTKYFTSPLLPDDFSTMDRCVLGRIFGNYSDGMAALGLDPAKLHAPAFGFAPGHTACLRLGSGAAYNALAEEWNTVLGLKPATA